MTAVHTCALDRKSTRLNSSHTIISYAVFCLKKKGKTNARAIHLQVGTSGNPSMTDDIFRLDILDIGRFVPTASVSSGTLTIAGFFFLRMGGPPRSSPFPKTPLFG